jgi:hypothetical protein
MNKLIEVYDNYCKKIDANRIHDVCFKIDFFQNNEKVNESQYQDYLSEMSRYNYATFFNQLQIVIETYGYEFLTNSNGEYFIKLKLYYPSIKSLLEYKSSMCIMNDCNDQVLDFSNFLCPKHLSNEIFENYDLINSCFYKRTDDLDNLYENYKKQTQLIDYLNSIINKDKGYFEINSYELGQTECRLQININNDDLIEIELEDEISALDCLILDDDDGLSESSESIEKMEKIFNTFFKNNDTLDNTKTNGIEEIEDDDGSTDCFDSDYQDDDDDEPETPENIIKYL